MFLFLSVINIDLRATNTPNYVIPGGESIGLQLETGIYIVGKYQVQTKKGLISPWANSDILDGDRIEKVDSKNVWSNKDIQEILKTKKNGEIISLSLKRSQTTVSTTIMVVQNSEGMNSLGLYIKDKIQGVGTLTYINPKNNTFGALGHGIIDRKIDLSNLNGSISRSRVQQITKALPGTPGEKQAIVSSNFIGQITSNKEIGIFGTINSRNEFNKNLIKVAKASDVKLGKAEIWTVIDNERVEKFSVEIIDLKKQTTPSIKGIKIKITDQKLLDKTGGIIQGMSGSPIVQNNTLVGAVSHVVVDNPSVGYGVYIEWMLINS